MNPPNDYQMTPTLFSPPSPTSTSTSTPHPLKPSAGDWSSIIGIVTAICGNIIISFALNTQRYAHVRLAREALGQDPDPRHSPHRARDRGNEQIRRQRQIAEERSERLARSEPDLRDGEVVAHAWSEADPLLSRKGGGGDEGDEDVDVEDEGDEKAEAGKKKNYLKSPFWWLGISLMVVGEAGNFLAYGFAPASIVSPLGVVALISNCIIAPIMLREKFRKRDGLGILISVAGAVTVVLSAKGSNPKLGPHSIWDLIKRWEFLTYFGITMVLIVVFMLMSNKYGQRSLAIDIGLVGLFGGYTALSTKGVASLLSYRLLKVFTFPIFYLLVAILALTALGQIKYMNRALQRFNSTQVIPTQFVVFTIFVVVGSAVLYRDFEKTSAADMGKFVGGVVLTFLGVWIITSGRGKSSQGTDTDTDDEQEISLVDEETPTIQEPPSTPQGKRTRPVDDSPASFVSATSRLAPTPKPRMQTTTSSPLLPSQRQYQTPQRALPSTPGQDEQPGSSLPRDWRKRNSIVDLLPGPYTSPLSGGLSVIVADSRRRDEDKSARLERRRSQRSSVTQRDAALDVEQSVGVMGRLKRNNTIEISSGPADTPKNVPEEAVVDDEREGSGKGKGADWT